MELLNISQEAVFREIMLLTWAEISYEHLWHFRPEEGQSATRQATSVAVTSTDFERKIFYSTLLLGS